MKTNTDSLIEAMAEAKIEDPHENLKTLKLFQGWVERIADKPIQQKCIDVLTVPGMGIAMLTPPLTAKAAELKDNLVNYYSVWLPDFKLKTGEKLLTKLRLALYLVNDIEPTEEMLTDETSSN